MSSINQVSVGIVTMSFLIGLFSGSILTAIAFYYIRSYFFKNKIKSKKELLKG
jgi:hypothetical protein